jgi:hypothetical protein
MFTLRGKAVVVTTLLGMVVLLSLFNWWLGLLAFAAAIPFGLKILRA